MLESTLGGDAIGIGGVSTEHTETYWSLDWPAELGDKSVLSQAILDAIDKSIKKLDVRATDDTPRHSYLLLARTGNYHDCLPKASMLQSMLHMIDPMCSFSDANAARYTRVAYFDRQGKSKSQDEFLNRMLPIYLAIAERRMVEKKKALPFPHHVTQLLFEYDGIVQIAFGKKGAARMSLIHEFYARLSMEWALTHRKQQRLGWARLTHLMGKVLFDLGSGGIFGEKDAKLLALAGQMYQWSIKALKDYARNHPDMAELVDAEVFRISLNAFACELNPLTCVAERKQKLAEFVGREDFYDDLCVLISQNKFDLRVLRNGLVLAASGNNKEMARTVSEHLLRIFPGAYLWPMLPELQGAILDDSDMGRYSASMIWEIIQDKRQAYQQNKISEEDALEDEVWLNAEAVHHLLQRKDVKAEKV